MAKAWGLPIEMPPPEPVEIPVKDLRVVKDAKEIQPVVAQTSRPSGPSGVLFTLEIRREHLWGLGLLLVCVYLWMRLASVSEKLALLEASVHLGTK